MDQPNIGYLDYVYHCRKGGRTPASEDDWDLQRRTIAREKLAQALEDSKEKVVVKPSNPKDMVGCLKVPFSVLPTPVIAECAIGMFEGALKYGRHNYRAIGVRASVYFDAAQRHLNAWWEGEDIDAESQLSHVTKAITSLMVLRDSMIRNNWEDDRPPATPELFVELNKRAAHLVEQYKDRTPKHYTNLDTKGS